MTSKQSFKTKAASRLASLRERLASPRERMLLRRRALNAIANIFKYALLIGLCFIILYPIILQLALAFRAPEDVNNPAILWIPERFSLKNFEVAMIALRYWEALRYTLILSTIVTVLQLASTSLAGYAFARLRFRGSSILFGLALFTIIVPQTVISLPLLRAVTKMGLVDKPITLFLMSGLGMGIRSGIFIYLFRQFYRGLPVELEEAAVVDGANAFQVFYRVMLPNAKPAIITVGLLSFVWQWNDFYFTKLFSGEPVFHAHDAAGRGSLRLAAGVGRRRGLESSRTGYHQQPVFFFNDPEYVRHLVMLPLLVIYFFVQKLFVGN